MKFINIYFFSCFLIIYSIFLVFSIYIIVRSPCQFRTPCADAVADNLNSFAVNLIKVLIVADYIHTYI